MKKILPVLLASFLATGCVTTGTHRKAVEALESRLRESQSEIDRRQAENDALQAQLMSTTKDRGKLQSSLEEMKKALEEMRARQAEERKRLKEFQDLTARFKSLTDAGTLSVKIIDGKMVVSLGSDVLFASGSARLSVAGKTALTEVSRQLAAIPGKRYQVEGHTDNAAIRTEIFPSNWELASARALVVLKTMIDSGMPAERVSAASYAETSPAQSNATPEGKAANRRIAIVVVPDLSSLPGYDELQKISQ